MEISPATPEDCRAIAEVHVESWQHAYQHILPAPYLASLSVSERGAMWRRAVEQWPSQLLVARADGRIAGFISFGACRDEGAPPDRAEIWAIYVRPAFWSGGVGARLWLAARQQIRDARYTMVSLWVISGNERALRFYERAGFSAEPDSRKQFELGGATIEEVRYVMRLAA
jgi:ribosomal protein S18 acetylase RimI-like enzyme